MSALTRATSEGAFLDIISAGLQHEASNASDWLVDATAEPQRLWIHVVSRHNTPPPQGWKLHISATVVHAEEVLRRALPVLLNEGANFKVSSSPLALGRLNDGDGGLSQVGKFITVYPNDDSQAVRLAEALDDATRGLRGPAVPSDRQFVTGSLVYYRYGSFGELDVQSALGMVTPAIRTPDGELIPDGPTLVYHAPDWAVDPFEAAGGGVEEQASMLLAERYALVSLLHYSPRGAVYLGLDLDTPAKCVLKQARRNATVTADGRDACDRLRDEATVLSRLAPDPRIPAVFDLVEHDNDLFLVMEDIEGETLESYVARHAVEGRFMSPVQIASWGRELARLLEKIHSAGFIYRDIKPTNIIITPEEQLRLVDFELAYELGDERLPHSRGTRGYVSPQQEASEPPTVADDIYSLGALLYLMATGAEPSHAPNAFDLLARPVELINPSCPEALVGVIARCLDPIPTGRFSNMAAVAGALRNINPHTVSATIPFGGEVAPAARQDLERHYQRLATRAEEALCRAAQPGLNNQGIVWVSTHGVVGGRFASDLNAGSAGAVLALSELVGRSKDPNHMDILAEGAHTLARNSPQEGKSLPGLYVGEAGIGAALLRASQVLGDPELVASAAERSDWVADKPYTSPDLFNGTAGRLRFHLLLWDETTNPEHLRAAIRAGEALLKAAEGTTDGGYRWTIPQGYNSLSGNAYLGYAHGAAGIADALLDLFEATDDERFLEAARRAGQWLTNIATPVLDDESGLDWPTVEEAATPAGAFWCRGAAGIGRFFLHASQCGAWSEAADMAARAARSAARGSRWAGPTQCHGLAGSIEFLLDMFQATGYEDYLAEVWTLGRLLAAFAVERDGVLVWPSESPTTFTPDYMVGYAGVAVCLLRLSNPDRVPYQLSRQGFRYRPS